MKVKPALSPIQLINMTMGFFGIQIGFALQNANTSRIFQTLGAEMDELAILWIAAPLTGLLVQPVIGYYSDRTWHSRLGRRRPYFLVGAIMASIALFMMPNSPTLWMAAGMLWIMDASINISMEPFRAFVGDMLPERQRTIGFMTQSLFIGSGAYFASLLPNIFEYFGVANTADKLIVPDTVKFSFYVGGILFLFSILWTVFFTKEYSPTELEEFGEVENSDFKRKTDSKTLEKNAETQMKIAIFFLSISAILTYVVYQYHLKKEMYVFTLGILGLFGVVFLVSSILQKEGKINGFVESVTDFQYMPKIMKHLAVVQFFSWFALFSMWIYTTPAVTSYIFGTSDVESELYGKGANAVNIFMANYNLVAAIFSIILILILSKIKIERRFIHFIALILGGLGLISFYYLKDANTLKWIPAIGVGIAWASILAIPYAMLTRVLPQNKLGYYMGVFNYFIVIPQLVAASILGQVLKMFDDQPIFALLIGGTSMIIAGLLSLFIRENKEFDSK